MPLSKKASRVYQALRGHKKERAKDVQPRPLRELRTLSDQAGTGGASELPKSQRVPEATVTTYNTGKKRRGTMGQNAVVVHEDSDTQIRPHKLRKTESRRQIRAPDERDELQEVADGDTSSEASDDSDDNVDESVAEDMRKLEESFKGISHRYRLINRIGEGKSSLNTFQF
jgi:hypothetical protein